VVHAHELKDLRVRGVLADAHPLGHALLGEAGPAVTGRAGLAAGGAADALGHLLREVGPPLLGRELLEGVDVRVFRGRVHGRRGLAEHHVRDDGVVEPAGDAVLGQDVLQGDRLLAACGPDLQGFPLQGPVQDVLAAQLRGQRLAVHVARAGNAEDRDVQALVLPLLQVDDERAGRAAFRHDADDLPLAVVGFQALLGFLVGADQVVHVLGEVVLAEDVPDELVRFLGGRDEHRGRRERQGPRLVAHDDVRLLFGQEPLRLFPQLLLYFFHVPDPSVPVISQRRRRRRAVS